MASGTADSSSGFRIELLGPVEAWVDGRPVALGGQRPRALFAVLALMGGRVVTIDRLIDELWGEEPPARARDSLQMHVSRLRKGLAEAGADGGRLVSHAGGYRLEVRPGERDVDRWQRALERARRARADGEPRVAREGVEEALGVWRGQPLGGVSANSLLAAERARLEEERLAAVIEGIELDLELGRHGELLGQLEALVIAHPFKERLVELQMLALYRCGRQADALAAFQAARGRFVDELGIEPAQPLRELHEDVLKHAAELSPPAEARPSEPRPATPSSRRLPVPPNRTIGREQDVVAVGERLRAGSVRLLTLTGPGGVGKTRLAMEAARAVQADFADGAHFVSLAALHRPEDVPAAIVEALGIIVLSGESADQAAERFLAAKHLLLVADNLEQLLAAAPFIGRLLEACPSLTDPGHQSRAARAAGRGALPGVAARAARARTPHDAQALADTDAVALFCERARAHDPDFDLGDGNAGAVAEICRRVDGLPLAIELAAARCGLLSPAEIAERLDTALGAPGAGARDAPARQQTLRATIDWSHELLSDAEQRCFARFAVFAGGATVEAAETITAGGLDTLDGLVTKSLLARRRHAFAPTRLGMLETIRAYAGERFASAADAEAVREDHYRYYLALAQRHGTERALRGAGAREHLARLDAEIDNLHAALGWAVAQPSAERALAMAAALGCYWIMRNRYADAVDWVDQALNLPGADAHPALRVRALRTKARCLWQMGRGAEQPAIVADGGGDRPTARRSRDPLPSPPAARRITRSMPSGSMSRTPSPTRRCTGPGPPATTGRSPKRPAERRSRRPASPICASASTRPPRCSPTSATSMTSRASSPPRPTPRSVSAASMTQRTSPRARLRSRARWTIRYVRMINSGNLGLAALLTGETDTASHAFREELTLCREMVVRPVVFEGLRGLAAVAVVDGDDKRAATLVGAADAHRYDRPEDPLEARLDRAFFEPARTRYGTDAWNAAAREGGALSFEDAIAYALEEPPV